MGGESGFYTQFVMEELRGEDEERTDDREEVKVGRTSRKSSHIEMYSLNSPLSFTLSLHRERPGERRESGPAVLQGACENRPRGHGRCVCIDTSVCWSSPHYYICMCVCVSLSRRAEMATHSNSSWGEEASKLTFEPLLFLASPAWWWVV